MTTIDKKIINLNLITVVSLILFTISYTYITTQWKEGVESALERLWARQDHIAERHTDLRQLVLKIQEDNNALKINITRIDTKLQNIENILGQISNSLK